MSNVYNVWVTVKFQVEGEHNIETALREVEEGLRRTHVYYDELSWEHEEADDA